LKRNGAGEIFPPIFLLFSLILNRLDVFSERPDARRVESYGVLSASSEYQ
jgi:hypothetical protein